MSFTQALIQILKDAQGANTKGQAGLMNQSNQIKGLGLNDATTNFANPLLDPSSGTSLGMSAQNEFDPSLNSIADQQKLATQNLGNITDLVNMTGDNYQKEQDRIQRAKDDAANRAASGTKLTATERYDQTLASYTNGFESGKMMPDGYTPIRDANGYVTPTAWKSAIADARSKGISRKDFIIQHGDYLYPGNLAAYGLTGVEQGFITKPASASSAETDAIINAILNK